ncbi:DUF192 domain-containing protein [Desulfomarina sp.]
MITGKIFINSSRIPLFSHINRTESCFERIRGLLGTASLEEGHGLLIKPCNSIHTFFMKIPIDVLFLDREDKVIRIKSHMKPGRLSTCLQASSVLELMAGQVHISGIQQGDRLTWTTR